eukprot:CAMPEP_0185699120 /NCGR_PEP_ID=MMETSP1164-20130828/6740_1 /TAXON_ID=1104430 /ORGANISM="Chrysoreinhardia sp, Strain CCMP2950" /LENGTH=43 /DNA_ID= /DNA_START= /DNA_END= /DNA_ORIENTATION=
MKAAVLALALGASAMKPNPDRMAAIHATRGPQAASTSLSERST